MTSIFQDYHQENIPC